MPDNLSEGLVLAWIVVAYVFAVFAAILSMAKIRKAVIESMLHALSKANTLLAKNTN